MTKALFAHNENMLVIVDQANTQRIQDVLNKQLREYENALPIVYLTNEEWTLASSFTTSWGLLTTLGSRSPATIGGQASDRIVCNLRLASLCRFSPFYTPRSACRSFFSRFSFARVRRSILCG